MNLHKVVSPLTMTLICILPLAGVTGCTGPMRGPANQTNTSQSGDIDNTSFYDDSYNTTN
jgi:hypothetical protein